MKLPGELLARFIIWCEVTADKKRSNGLDEIFLFQNVVILNDDADNIFWQVISAIAVEGRKSGKECKCTFIFICTALA